MNMILEWSITFKKIKINRKSNCKYVGKQHKYWLYKIVIIFGVLIFKNKTHNRNNIKRIGLQCLKFIFIVSEVANVLIYISQ